MESHFRINVFNPAVDAVLQDFELRFEGHQRQAFNLSLLLPTQCAKNYTQPAEEKMKVLAALKEAFVLYEPLLDKCDWDLFKAEYKVWSGMCNNQSTKVVDTAIAAVNMCDNKSLPNVHRLLQVLSVLPVSTAEAERVFSKVKRTLTYLRTTMSEGRLEALVLMQAHRESLPSTAEIISYFSVSGKRKSPFKLNV